MQEQGRPPAGRALKRKKGVGISALNYLPPAEGVFSHPETGKKSPNKWPSTRQNMVKSPQKLLVKGAVCGTKIAKTPLGGVLSAGTGPKIGLPTSLISLKGGKIS